MNENNPSQAAQNKNLLNQLLDYYVMALCGDVDCLNKFLELRIQILEKMLHD